MADFDDLAITTTLPDDAEVVIQQAGALPPVRMDGASMRTAFKGDQGDQGATGTQGNQGSQGQQGNTGPQGNLGNSGPTGAAGNDGTDGAQGVQGLYTVEIYRNVLAAQASITPVGGSIVVATAVTVAPNLWATTLTPATTGQKTIISRATVNPETQSGTITPTWSASFDAGGTGPSGPQGPMGAAGAAGAMGTAGAAGQDSTVPGPTGPTGGAGAMGTCRRGRCDGGGWYGWCGWCNGGPGFARRPRAGRIGAGLLRADRQGSADRRGRSCRYSTLRI